MRVLVLMVLSAVIGSVAQAHGGCDLQGAYECNSNGQDFFMDFSNSSYGTNLLRIVETGDCDFQAKLDGSNRLVNGTCLNTNITIHYSNGSCHDGNASLTYSKTLNNSLLSTRVLNVAEQSHNGDSDSNWGGGGRPNVTASGTDKTYSNGHQTGSDSFSTGCTAISQLPPELQDRIFANGFERCCNNHGDYEDCDDNGHDH